MLLEEIKVAVWRAIYAPVFRVRHRRSLKKFSLDVMTSEETIKYIIDNDCSVSRFGDGEFQMIQHYLERGNKDNFEVDSFQEYSERLGKRLLEVISTPADGHIVCVPYALINPSVYRGYDMVFFEREWLLRKEFLCRTLGRRKIIGDTCFTRFYLHRRDIWNFDSYISSLRLLWDKKSVVIVEGEFSRLGVGNNLFDNCSSIMRIICPSTNAFGKYSEIIEAAESCGKDKLFILALGHTATVLAYDLSNDGYRALDIGHVDIEYEWYKMGAKSKVPVPGKYVNEVKEGRISHSADDAVYSGQIIRIIL